MKARGRSIGLAKGEVLRSVVAGCERVLTYAGIRITGSRVVAANIAQEKPMWWREGWFPGISRVIIRGETDRGCRFQGASSVDAGVRIEPMGEWLNGADPLDSAGCEAFSVSPSQILKTTKNRLEAKVSCNR